MKFFLLVLVLSCTHLIFAQEQIFLFNPSFEDLPRHSKIPTGWYDCGDPYESPPDIHPTTEGSFGVTTPPQDGETYLGMVTRDNDTQEAVGKRLETPLRAGNCYSFTIYLAQSASYVSLSRRTNEEVSYTTPVILRIWGGTNYCKKTELLGASSFIAHGDWREYEFKFKPQQDLRYLKLEAFYELPVLYPYNGNLLVDNMSPISISSCDSSFYSSTQLFAAGYGDVAAINNRPSFTKNTQRDTRSGRFLSTEGKAVDPYETLRNNADNDSNDKGDYYQILERNLPPVWELDEVPTARLPWNNYQISDRKNLPTEQVHLTKKNEPETNYLRLFAENYGKNIIVFVIDMSNLNEAKKIRKRVIREAKYWDYPEWAYTFKKLPWQEDAALKWDNPTVEEVYLNIAIERKLDYYQLFYDSYGEVILYFVIDVSDLEAAKEIKKRVVEKARYWGYPRDAYQFIKE